jgi:hypothetical protein
MINHINSPASTKESRPDYMKYVPSPILPFKAQEKNVEVKPSFVSLYDNNGLSRKIGLVFAGEHIMDPKPF